ncbi:MAG: hypothetical protein V1765_03260 [bacterium]
MNPRIPPQIKQAEAIVPSGVIVAWPSTDASIPVGWARVTAFDTYFVEGTTANPSASAFGNSTHAHVSPNHQHTIDHTHTNSLGNASGAYTSAAASAGNTDNHVHTTNVTPNTDLNVAQSATATLGTASNDPPYTKVIFIKSNGTADIPNGAWALWQSDTLPGSWTRQSGNKFLKGADVGGDGSGTGGISDAHTHTDSGHTHTENAHTHTVTTNAGAAGTGKSKPGTGMALGSHAHTISGGNQTATEQSGAGVLANGDGQPPYYKLNIIQNATGNPGLPDGIIAMWDGTVASIPTNWILCDGSGTCPNLNDKFIKGANADSESGTTGGALTHTHGAGAAHSHTIDSHTHTLTVGGADLSVVRNGTGTASTAATAHTHTFTLSGGGTTATQTITADANSPNDNRPPYKEIVFIKYVAPVIPTFTAGPAESTASTTASPTTEGASITFQGTATAGTNWKLLICKTSGTSGTDCDGGASDRWCVSASGVASASQNTCAYTTTSSDQDIKDWYGYACDTTSCASESQGSGDSGSPFVVNNPPPFTAFSDDSGKNPGETVTFSSTANDTANPGDTIQLYVCKTAVFSGGSCTGGEWCHTTTGVATNPTCTYGIPATNVDKNYNAYGYVIDSHGLGSSGGSTGSDSTLTVSNVTPSITAVDIHMYDTDGSGPMVLTTAGGETIDFYVTFIVTDANSCEDSVAGNEIASAIINVYRSAITSTNCDTDVTDDNNNNCYADAGNIANTSAQCVQNETVDSCSGPTDFTVGWKCEFPIQYHADPTDAGTFEGQNWLASVKATDDDAAATAFVEVSSGIEMSSAIYITLVDTTINYGTVNLLDTSADQATTVEAAGNVKIDVNVSSAQANALCSNYPTCSGSVIADSYQHYGPADVAYGSMTVLSITPNRVEVNIPKTTITGSPENADVHWKIQIPTGKSAVAHTGSNNIAGVEGN